MMTTTTSATAMGGAPESILATGGIELTKMVWPMGGGGGGWIDRGPRSSGADTRQGRDGDPTSR